MSFGASFARRVAMATALAIVTSGIAVALVTAGLTTRIALADEDARLSDAARSVARELREESGSIASVLEEEARDRAASGVAVAVFRDGALLAGEATLGNVESGECATLGAHRECGAAAGHGRVAIAGSATERLEAHRSALLLASAVAVALAALLGTFASLLIARWTAAPLERLRVAVARVEPERPSAARLGPDEGIMEVDALRAALGTTLERLGSALAQSRRFAADAAHELRTPLTTIRGELELLRESRLLDAEVSSATTRAVATVARLSTLVDRLLVLATPLEPLEHTEPVTIADLFDDVRVTLPSIARSRMVIEPSDDAVVVRGDPALLGSMLGNGIDNALKFSGDADVHVRARAEDDRAIVEIDDVGPGIAPEDRERVFDAFHRTPRARASGLPGHGIGLALVAHVAALHGGRASFAEQKRGARLRIELPLASRRRAP